MKVLKIKSDMKTLKVLLVSFLLFPFSSCNEVSLKDEKIDLKAMEDPVASDRNALYDPELFLKNEELNVALERYFQEEGSTNKLTKLREVISAIGKVLPPEYSDLAIEINRSIGVIFSEDPETLDESMLLAAIGNIKDLYKAYNAKVLRLGEPKKNPTLLLIFLLNYFMREQAKITIDSLEQYKKQSLEIKDSLPEKLEGSIDEVIDLLKELLASFTTTEIQPEINQILNIINEEDLIKKIRDYDGEDIATYNLFIISNLRGIIEIIQRENSLSNSLQGLSIES